MIRRIILLGLACGLMVGSVGCGPLCAVLCPGAMCGQPYGDASCGPVYAASCGPGCDTSCGSVPAAGCAVPCVETAACGPLDLIAPLFAVGGSDSFGGCGGGCGETYYGDYPTDCDPCDPCGNYTGGSMCR